MTSATQHADEGPTEAERGRFTESPTKMSTTESGTEDDESEDDSSEEEENQLEDAEEDDEEEGDSAEDEEESEEEDEEEDEEPVLKYLKVEGALPDLLKKDSASAIAVSGNRLLVSRFTVPYWF